MDDKVLDYLVDYHHTKLRRIEQEVCQCFRNCSLRSISQRYPGCVHILAMDTQYSQVVDVYWDIIEAYMKEHCLTLLMEAYLLQGEVQS